jgi:hypothetical protein
MRWLSLFGISLFVVMAAAQQPSNAPPIQWQSSFGGAGIDAANAVAELRDGSFVVSGSSRSPDGGNKTNTSTGPWLVFVSTSGNKTAELTLTNEGDQMVVCATTDGGFVASASVSCCGSGPSATLKFQANRSLQWEFPSGGQVQQSSDGGYIVLANNTSNAVLTKLSGSGTQQWSRVITNTDINTIPRDIRQTADDGYVGALAMAPAPAFTHSALVVRWDAGGNELWHTNLGGIWDQELKAVRQLTDGGFVLAGYTENEPIIGGSTFYADGWVVRLSSAGAKLSETHYGGAHWDEFRSVEVLGDGGLLLAGFSFSQSNSVIVKQAPKYGDRDYWLLRVDAAGNRVWDATFGGTNGFLGGRNELTSMLLTTDGGILLAGNSDSQPSGNKTSPNFGDYDYWVLKVGLVVPLTVARNGSEIRIGFNAVVGQTYALLARNRFTNHSAWSVTGQSLAASSNGPAFFSVPRTNVMQVFRVGIN